MRHLTVQQISGSLDGALSGVSLELVVRHLSSCHECRERHARLTKQDDALRRLLACEFPEVFLDDMFARLGVVLEAESHGQMPPEHALPPELPPLAPDPPPSRELTRPPSAAMRIPLLPSEAEQKRRAAEELKAAEAAALSSLEQLMREMQELKSAASTAPQPADSTSGSAAPPVPEPFAAAPAAPDPFAATPPPPPASILVLPPDVLASLRNSGSGRTDSAPASTPEPEPETPPTPEPFEEPALTWVVVDGPLPVGPDIGFEQLPEPDDVVPQEPPGIAAPEPVHVTAPESLHVPPEPVRVVAPEPMHVPPPEPVRAVTPGPRPVPRHEPGRVVVHHSPPARHAAPKPTPLEDPYADYEERLDREPPGHARYRPPGRRPGRRVVGVAMGVVALIVALGSIGYLPPVIRVSVPMLPKPRLPRFEIVSVPVAPAAQPERPETGAPPAAASKPDAQAETMIATVRDAAPRVVPAPSRTLPVTASPIAKPAREPAPRPAASDASAPIGRAIIHADAPADGAVNAARTEPASPVSRSAAPIARPTEPEPQVDDGASWPLLCGVVLDDAGSPVAGARVTLADLDLGARTDRRGRFCIAAPPGDRTLSAVAAGFATHRRIVSLGTANLEVSIALSAAP